MKCPICINERFIQSDVLKTRLIKEWNLTNAEVEYTNKQQGFHCSHCNCNLRSITLAASIMNHYSFNGSFKHFIYSKYASKLKMLEINSAGGLHSYLKKFKNYTFAEYPEVDMQNLPYLNDSFDLIVHSDTLEHVENSSKALKECFRVLVNGGVLFYTIPIINSRMTIRRDFLANSYHGLQEELQGDDYKVYTEYGADFWVETINAGFKSVSINTILDLSSLAISAIKKKDKDFQQNFIYSTVPNLKRISKKIKKYLMGKYGIHR
jgi:SAM-dependent methyltransferase